MLLRSNFSSFPHYYIYIFLTPGVKLHIHLLNVIVQFIVFLTLSTLICRSTDISKCFSESLGIRDNGSRLYQYFTENRLDIPKLSSFASWPGAMINPHRLELPMSRTNFHGSLTVYGRFFCGRLLNDKSRAELNVPGENISGCRVLRSRRCL